MHGSFWSLEIYTVTKVQILEEVIFILLCGNKLGKDMNLSILPQAMYL